MNENEIIGKLYVENQKMSAKLKECERILKEQAHNNIIRDNVVQSKLRLKICDAQKYMMANKDTVPESFYNGIMEILERRTDI